MKVEKRLRRIAVPALLAGMIAVMPSPTADLRAAETWRGLVEAAGYAYEAGRPYQAQELLEQAVDHTEPGTEPRAAVLNNLAIVLEANGYLDAAEQLYGWVIGLWAELLGPGHLNVSRTLGNLGDLHHRRGELEEAADAYALAVKTAEQSVGDGAMEIRLALYRSYAEILDAMGRAEAAAAVRAKIPASSD